MITMKIYAGDISSFDLEIENVRYQEVCFAITRMEEMKQKLLQIEFEPEFELVDNGEDEDGEYRRKDGKKDL